MVPPKINSDHCSAPTRQTQQCGRQRESRDFYDSSEWQIDPQVIQPFLRRCSVDLFASRLTALLPTYASWKPAPGTTYTDAMTFDWSLLKGYAFPPFSLIAPVLKNISQDKGDLVLVAPVCQAQPWWPALLNLLIKSPVIIPNSKHLLRDPASPLSIHPMYPRLYLATGLEKNPGRLSGTSTFSLRASNFLSLLARRARTSRRQAVRRLNF